MSFSSIVGGIGAGIGRAVRGASRGFDALARGVAPVNPAVPSAPSAESLPTGQEQDVFPDFTLESLGANVGPAPDATKPEYQGETGQARYRTDYAQWEHAQDINKKLVLLDQMMREAMPHRNFKQEYLDEVKALQQHMAERPQENPLAKGALTLASFNPADQGRAVAGYEKAVEQKQEASDKGFQTLMGLKRQAHEQAAQEALAKGNLKLAYSEKAMAMGLAAEEAKTEQAQKAELETIRQQGMLQRTRERGEMALKAVRARIAGLAAAHGAGANFETMVMKELAKNFGPQAITKDYVDPDRMPEILLKIEEMASNIEKLRKGEGEGGKKLPRLGEGKGAADKTKFGQARSQVGQQKTGG